MNNVFKSKSSWFSGSILVLLVMMLLFVTTSESWAQTGETNPAWGYYHPTATPTATARPPTATPTPMLPACQVTAITFDKYQYQVGDTIEVTTHLADINGTPLGGAKVTARVEKEVSTQASTGFGFVDRIGEYDGVYNNADVAGMYYFIITASDPTGTDFKPCTGQAAVSVLAAPTATPTDTPSPTISPTPTNTLTLTPTPTTTLTITPTPTHTPTPTPITPVPTTPIIFFDPSTVSVPTGGQATNAVMVNNMTDLTTVQVEVAFDPAVGQVVDADTNIAGIQIKPDDIFRSGSAVVVENEVDNNAGRIKFAGTLTDSPINEGTLFEIEWQAAGAVDSNTALRLENIRLFDSNANEINASIQNGTVQVEAVSTSVSGYITLQGRNDNSGVVIKGERGSQTQTNAQGFFSLPGQSSFVAEFPGYLSAQAGLQQAQDGAETANVGTLVLLAGDVNGDDLVNILDLAYMATHYQSNDTLSDLNGDGQVNIQDLALAANNYAVAGPLTNWQ